MKSRHFRFLAILGILSILSVGILQFFWFQQAYNVRKKEFELKVFQALKEVAAEVYEFNGNQSNSNYPVEQLSENYYVVMINDQIDLPLLEALLQRKFKEKAILIPYSYTIYDCSSDQMVYGSPTINADKKNEELLLPKWEQDQYYFGVYFPEVSTSLLGGMGGWFILSVVLLLVLIFFGFSLFIIFQQKRYSEIQRDFVNNMTHELKTPLTSIRLSSKVLSESVHESDKEYPYLKIIREESGRLEKQIENILLRVRDQKKINLDRENLDPLKTLKDIFEDELKVSEKQYQYEVKHSNEINFVLVNKIHFHQIFSNLIQNSIKYGPQDLQISMDITTTSNSVIFRYHDNGNGIPAKYAKKIFQAFFRIPTGNRHDVKGYGLGLHHVKKITKLNGGSISWKGNGKEGYFEIKLSNGK